MPSVNGPPEGSASADSSATFLGVANALLRHRRILVTLPVAGAVLAGAISVITPAEYTAASRFVLRSQAPQSILSTFASEFGFAVAAPSFGESSGLYAELVKSHDLLRGVVLAEYQVPDEDEGVRSGTLVEIYGLEDLPEQRRVRSASKRLQRAIDLEVDYASGVLTLRTRAGTPELATQVNQQLLSRLNEFNLEKRHLAVSEERSFLEQRLAEVRSDLAAAEQDLKDFLDRNRRYFASPQLTIEEQRLERRVMVRQEIYVALVKAYEETRLNEIRSVPVFSIIDQPLASRSDQAPLVSAFLAFVIFGMLGVIIALLLDFLKRQPTANPHEYADFARLWAATRSEARAFARGGLRMVRRDR